MTSSAGTASRDTVTSSRLVGVLPKIGIRPAIDGRRKGVRESLERQALEMASRVAQLFRPSAWTAFGANEPQGADFRACASFGPLYGR